MSSWVTIAQVPASRFDLYEGIGGLVAGGVFAGLALYVKESAPALTFGFLTLVLLTAMLRPAWQHRNVEPVARRLLWCGAVIAAVVLVRVSAQFIGG